MDGLAIKNDSVESFLVLSRSTTPISGLSFSLISILSSSFFFEGSSLFQFETIRAKADETFESRSIVCIDALTLVYVQVVRIE